MLLLASLAGGAEAAWRGGGPILHRIRSIDGLAGTSAEREIHALRRQKAARTAPERKIDSHLARTAGAVEGAVPVHVRLGSVTAQDLAELKGGDESYLRDVSRRVDRLVLGRT